MTRAFLSGLITCSCLSSALAERTSEQLYAWISLEPLLGKTLELTREGKPFRPNDGRLHVEFRDPSESGEVSDSVDIKAILLDAENTETHFFVITTLVNDRGKPVSETAKCSWGEGKKVAVCIVDCDGGSFHVTAQRERNSLNHFAIRLGTEVSSGGFRVAAEPEDKEQGVGPSYSLSVTGDHTVTVPLNFTRSGLKAAGSGSC